MGLDLRIVGERRAWRWCALCLDRMRADPDAVRAVARRNLDRVERQGSCHPGYIARWRTLLSLPPEAIAGVVLAESDEAQVLRSTAPFAGVLDNATRWAIWREIRP